MPAIEAMSFGDLEAGSIAIVQTKRETSHNLNRAHQDAPRKPIHVNSELGGYPGFFCQFDPVRLDRTSMAL